MTVSGSGAPSLLGDGARDLVQGRQRLSRRLADPEHDAQLRALDRVTQGASRGGLVDRIAGEDRIDHLATTRGGAVEELAALGVEHLDEPFGRLFDPRDRQAVQVDEHLVARRVIGTEPGDEPGEEVPQGR